MLTYDQAIARLKGRCRAKLPGVATYLEWSPSENAIDVVYHSTAVVTIHPNGSYTLRSGGYKSATTKSRINAYSCARVWQHKHVWYVGQPGQVEWPFEEGMTVHHLA